MFLERRLVMILDCDTDPVLSVKTLAEGMMMGFHLQKKLLFEDLTKICQELMHKIMAMPQELANIWEK